MPLSEVLRSNQWFTCPSSLPGPWLNSFKTPQRLPDADALQGALHSLPPVGSKLTFPPVSRHSPADSHERHHRPLSSPTDRKIAEPFPPLKQRLLSGLYSPSLPLCELLDTELQRTVQLRTAPSSTDTHRAGGKRLVPAGPHAPPSDSAPRSSPQHLLSRGLPWVREPQDSPKMVALMSSCARIQINHTGPTTCVCGTRSLGQ